MSHTQSSNLADCRIYAKKLNIIFPGGEYATNLIIATSKHWVMTTATLTALLQSDLASHLTSCVCAIQWSRGREGARGLNFGLSENCRKILFLSENFRPKMLNLGLKTPILGKFRGKNKISTPIISFVRNLQLSVGKLQLPAQPIFNPRHRWLSAIS